MENGMVKEKERFNLIMNVSKVYAFCIIPEEKDEYLNKGNKILFIDGWRSVSDYTERIYNKQRLLKAGETPEMFKVEGIDGVKFRCDVEYVESFFNEIKGFLRENTKVRAYLPKKCEPFVFRVDLEHYESVLYLFIAPREE